QFAHARAELEGALANIPQRSRGSTLDAGVAHIFLSDVAYEEDKLDDAAAHAREALQIFERAGAPDRRRAEVYVGLANVELKRKNRAEALAGYEAALALRQPHLSREDYQIGVNEGSIAEVLVELGRHQEALSHLREAERVLDRGATSDPSSLAWILTVHGE